jgi:hypothetical protein
MKNEALESLVIKSEIVRNYTLVVALLVASACMIYAVWPTTEEPLSASGGIPVIDLKAFVRNDVSCKDGVAVVAIHTADGDKPIYEPISVPQEGNQQPASISCSQDEYQLNGVRLSVLELGTYALDSAQR